ncbi:MAG: hypothetical protein QOF78_1410 [Phycisphaerales bacterium]|jgi:hypothetical protein|nr:hypothetical protein [Phycisphaerales bacterium]
MAEARPTVMKPKFRRRRAAVIVLVGFVCLAALHAGWGWHVERVLQARVDELSALGERIMPVDFRPPSSSFGRRENAAADLLAAAAIVDDNGPESEALYWLPTTMPVNAKAWPHLARAKQWYEPALRRIERAQLKPICQFDHNLSSPILENLKSPELNGMRDLANFLALTALVEHHDGRHDLVVRRLAQMMYVADACEQTPAEIGHYVTLAINQSAAFRTEQFAPELNIGSGEGQARPEDVRQLIAALLDESKVQAGQKHALQAERMLALDTIKSIGRGNAKSLNYEIGPVLGYIGRPYFHANALRAIERQTEVAAIVCETSDWPTAAGRLGAIKPLEDRYLLARAFASSPDRGVRRHFETLTDRRLAATALAVRFYQLDYAGAPPHRLDDLVPKYLPAVPLDPMAAGNRRISYLPRAEHAILYSVGRNGNEDNGSESAMPRIYGELDEWARLDRVFYLTSRPRDVLLVERPGQSSEVGYAAAIAGEPGEQTNLPPWERFETAVAAPATQPFTPR